MANIQKRGDSYRIRVSCGLDVRGQQIVKSMTWKPNKKMTEKQLEKELARQVLIFEEECQGVVIISSNVKFETLAKQFLEHVETNNLLRPKTISKLKELEVRTYAAIGHLRIDKITHRHIQSFVENLQEPGVNKRYPDRGLSPKSVRHYANFISDVFRYAIKEKLIRNNPCDSVDLPPVDKKEVQCYTLVQAQEFFKTLYNEAPLKYQLFFTLDALGGFRRGELCGLEWKDLDFENNLITIRRTSLYIAGKGIFTDTTKTESSKRCLKLSRIVFDLAKEYKIEQNATILKVGDKWQDNDRLFVNWCGKPIHPDTPYDYLRKFCEKYNLPKTSVHQFRHFNASVLISNNVDIRTVAAALGHAKPTTSLNIYSHAFAEAQAKASDAIADIIDLKKA